MNLEQEMIELKRQVEEIKSLLHGRQAPTNMDTQPESAELEQKKQCIHSDTASLLNRLKDSCGSDGTTGKVTYLGAFTSGERQSAWIQNEISTDVLLRLIENRTAEKVLSCIGNNDRLNILLALLKQPMTVAALVEKHGYNSTGQVYHHLKPLLAADLIEEDKDSAKGTYIVKAHRVQGIIMLLAGIHELIDMKHSKGDWAAEIHSGATMVDERYMTTAGETQKIIETYFSSLTPLTLKNFPSREKRKLVVLRVISEQFEAGRRYAEKEVNLILKSVHADFANLRRYLIDYGFMKRTQDCGEYWLNVNI